MINITKSTILPPSHTSSPSTRSSPRRAEDPARATVKVDPYSAALGSWCPHCGTRNDPGHACTLPERISHLESLITRRLSLALELLNPSISDTARTYMQQSHLRLARSINDHILTDPQLQKLADGLESWLVARARP